jgi:hypothetical protein
MIVFGLAALSMYIDFWVKFRQGQSLCMDLSESDCTTPCEWLQPMIYHGGCNEENSSPFIWGVTWSMIIFFLAWSLHGFSIHAELSSHRDVGTHPIRFVENYYWNYKCPKLMLFINVFLFFFNSVACAIGLFLAQKILVITFALTVGAACTYGAAIAVILKRKNYGSYCESWIFK